MNQYVKYLCKIQGVTPCLMDNGRKADPRDEFSKSIHKLIKSKVRGQVFAEEQLVELARLQFMGGLYLTEDGRPGWPGENIEALFLAAARKFKKGKVVPVALLIDGTWPLIYDGPKSAEKLWQHGGFHKTCQAKQKGFLVTRPKFDKWELEFEVQVDSEVIDESDIRQWLEVAGYSVGLSAWRPKYGRFVVLSIKAM